MKTKQLKVIHGRQVALFPAGAEDATRHFQNTISRPVPLSLIAQHVEQHISEKLKSLSETGRIATWGLVPGKNDVNARKWKKLRQGALCLFAGHGGIYAVGRMMLRTHSPSLSPVLWGADDREQTWEYVLFLEDIQHIRIPYESFNRVLGHERDNFVRGFTILNNEKSIEMQRKLARVV